MVSLHATVALVGNPNTGKTTLFNALSGLRQRVGNYPGVTVETKKGQFRHDGRTFDVIDLPGTYSLAPRSPDEMVAVDVILGQQTGEPRPDVVVAIVDASNLERNLYLTTQALELGVPVVVALNMIDVAEGQGLRIDTERLSQQLGLPLVPIQANKGKNLDRLKQAIADAAHGAASGQGAPFPEAFEKEVIKLRQSIGDGVAPFLVRRLLLDVGGYTETRLEGNNASLKDMVQESRERLRTAGCPVPAVEARARYAWIREVTAGCVERPTQRPVTWTDRIDRVLTHPIFGSLIFAALMFVVFVALFYLAQWPMDWIDGGKTALATWLSNPDVLPPGPLTSLLVQGVVEGVGGVLIFLPQIIILFGFIAVLEDCGYMARAAFLMDKLMARAGLSGKSFIPMLSSMACAVPGIMATRVIENRRDRLATIMVAPLMSCSARLPVYTLLIAAFLTVGYAWWVPGLTMFVMYMIGLVVAPLVAFALKRTLLRGETPVFVMEMPLYKWPSWWSVLRRMTDAAWAFVRRAGTLILASMIVVWALLYFPRAHDPQTGMTYESQIADAQKEIHQLQKQVEQADKETKERIENRIQDQEAAIGRWDSAWKRASWLGWMGHEIEPVVRPLGWDWKIGMAALASFPAREVVIGTLSIIYAGEPEVEEEAPTETAPPEPAAATEDEGEHQLQKALQNTRWEPGSGRDGQKVFTVPVALSIMVFFALCCQCASTLAIIRRETRSWFWPVFTFVYMTVLAYIGALAVYQVGRLIA